MCINTDTRNNEIKEYATRCDLPYDAQAVQKIVNLIKQGVNPLHVAAMQNNTTCAQFFKENAKTDLMQKGFCNLTAIDYAFTHKLQLLGQNPSNQLAISLKECNTQATKKCLDEMEKLSQDLRSGQLLSPLHSAVLNGDHQALETLFSKDKNKALEVDNLHNFTLLHLAAMGKSTEVINLLVTYNAEMVHAKDIHGRTAAHYAAINFEGAILHSLMQAGARLTERDHNNVSVLSLFGAAALKRDPLQLSKAQIVLFVAIIGQLMLAAGTLASFSYESSARIAILLSLIPMCTKEIAKIAIHFQNVDAEWKKWLALAGPFIPYLSLPVNIWRYYNRAMLSFAGIKASYQNFYNRPWEATRSAVVNGVNVMSPLANIALAGSIVTNTALRDWFME